jgi:integrase
MASTRERNGRFTGLYRDATGKQKSAGTFGTEGEALARAQVAELDANPPKPVEVYPKERRGKITVAAYAPKWLDNEVLEDTSRETYRRTLNRLVKHVGDVPRDEVTPDHIKRMIKVLRKDGLADATISATVDLARSMLGEAACAGVNFRIKDRREMMAVTRQQAQAIEDAIHPRYKLLVRTAFATGCRWGELIAIRGTDVEARGTGYVLKVRRTVIEVNGERSERPHGKSPKAKRDITIPQSLALDLMAFGAELSFLNARGGFLRRNCFRSEYWLRAVRKAGIPGLRVHDMRHSAISWWANSGIPLASVRDRAGHSDISVTSRYIHAMPTDDDPFLAVLGEVA